MTTEELFEQLKKHGFDIRKENELACNIYYIFYKELYCVQLFPNLEFEGTFVMTSGFKGLKRERKEVLYKTLTEYAATPIEERTPKRCFKYRLKPIAGYCQRNDTEFLNYGKREGYWFLDNSGQSDRWQTIFEENDPVLNDVNLEMFEAIEVDHEGNEI